MANRITIRRGSGTPTTSNTEAYELAYDYSADKLYIHDGAGSTMVEIGSGASGGDADTLDGLDSTQFLRSDANDETTGELTAAEFIGPLRGPVKFKAKADVAITKGDAVYVSGISGNTPTIGIADANDSAKMPAFGLAEETVSANANIQIYTLGDLPNLNTSSYEEGDVLYVSTAGTTGNTLTATPPSGESSQIQNIGKVLRRDSSVGRIRVGGAGRSNATPNLDQDKIFLGNASNQSVSTALSSIGLSKFNNDSGFTTNTGTVSFNGSTANGLLTYGNSTTADVEANLTFNGTTYLQIKSSDGVEGGLRLSKSTTDATHTKYHISHRDDNQSLIIYSHDGTTFRNWITLDEPNALLKLGSNSSALCDIDASGNFKVFSHLELPYGEINDAGTDLNIVGTNAVTLQTSAGTALTIPDASTNVGIGTAIPSHTLDVVGNAEISATLQMGSTAGQSGAKISAIHSGNSYEFGHVNSAGYRSNLGANYNNGYPFLAFYAESSENTSNQYTTRGIKGVVLTADTSNNFTINQVTTASAANQNLTERIRIDSSGRLLIGDTSVHYSGTDLQVGNTSDSQNGIQIQTSATGNGYVLFGDGTGASAYRGQVRYDHTNDSLNLSAGGSETVYVKGGNVGIGVASPSVELHVKDASSHAQLRIETDSASHGAYLELEGSANKYQIYNVGGDLGIDEAGQATRLTIKDSTGNVGIGANNPLRKLHVVGSMAVNEGTDQYYGILMGGGESNDPKITIGDWHNSSGSIMWDSSENVLKIDSQHSTANRDIVFTGNDFATEYMRVNATGLGIGTNSPGEKLTIKAGGDTSQEVIKIRNSSNTEILSLGIDGSGDGYLNFNSSPAVINTNGGHLALTPGGSGNVGIGTVSPEGKVHIFNGDASVAPDSDGDELVVENSGDSGISILSGESNGNTGSLIFGSQNDGNGAGVVWDYYSKILNVKTQNSSGILRFASANNSEAMRIDSSQNVGIGTTDPASYNNDGDDFVIAGTGNTGMSIASGTSSNGSIMFADGTGGTAGYRGAIKYNHGSDYMHFNTAAAERMRIDSAGHVGIGTQSPSSYELQFGNAGDKIGVDLSSGGTTRIAEIEFYNGSDGSLRLKTDNASSGGIEFHTEGSKRMIVARNGNVGVGNLTSPAQPFQTHGTSADTRTRTSTSNHGTYFESGVTADSAGILLVAGHASSILNIYLQGSGGTQNQFRFTHNGDFLADEDIVAYSTSVGSDRKLKDNIKDTSYGLSDVMKMRAVEFDWKEKRDKAHDIGVIAQEIEEIIPEVVKEVETLNTDGETHKVVDYAKLSSVLIKAIQEQQEQINKLEEKLNG